MTGPFAPRAPCQGWLPERARAVASRRATWLFTVVLAVAPCSVQRACAHGRDVGVSAFAREDYRRSAAIFIRRAERGEAAAQTFLGYMYSTGRGVPQNNAVAVFWLRRGADQGFPTAQFLLGLMVDKGHGVKQDFVEAEVWLNLATARASRADRDYWTRIRDAVAAKLTLAEVAEAQDRALAWFPVSEHTLAFDIRSCPPALDEPAQPYGWGKETAERQSRERIGCGARADRPQHYKP